MSGSVLEKKKLKSNLKHNNSNEFESYLQTRRENTTYNGIELETANWHKEVFGFNTNK